jgi:hypothetical protein
MEREEFIICSAVWYQDGLKHESQPLNIDSGFVVTGRRHGNCFATVKAISYLACDNEVFLTALKRIENRMSQKEHIGFLTNLDRFVSRKEAWIIAKENNQIKFGLEASENGDNSILISENLW